MAEVHAWRSADPRHEAAFQRSERLWQAAGSATRTPYSRAASSGRLAAARYDRGPGFAFAAIVGTVAIAGGVYVFERPRTDMLGARAELASSTASRTVRLPDGSTVALGPDSQISTDFDGVTRGIALLRGNARFTVAHDAAHPFVVSVGGRTVTARGTIFDVALRPAGLSVMMIEGVVEVARKRQAGAVDAGAIRLARGQRLVVVGGREQISEPAGTPVASTRRDYPPTAIAKVIDDANIGAHKPILLDGQTVGAMKVEGRFDLSNTAALARQFAAALDLDLLDDGRSLILSRKSTPEK